MAIHNFSVDALLEQYHQEIEEHKRAIKGKLYHQLRKYNITHKDFPQKWQEFFNQTRQEFLNCYLLEELQNEDNISKELQTFYGLGYYTYIDWYLNAYMQLYGCVKILSLTSYYEL